MRNRSSNWVGGVFLLAAAAFLVVNQFNGFTRMGTGSIIAVILALAFLVHCLIDGTIAQLPIPFAVLYLVFQRRCGQLPYIQPRILIIATVLAVIGLSFLLPRRYRYRPYEKHHHAGDHPTPLHTEDGTHDNNPVININFGTISRRLHADSLETAQLQCNFGALEIFFDQAVLSPNGAEATLNCSFGAIKLYIPRHWRIIDQLKCSLGSVDIDKRFTVLEENAPQLTLSGSVSLGGIEIRYV